MPRTNLNLMKFLRTFWVGSSRPFAGYSNSDFAYPGIGASPGSFLIQVKENCAPKLPQMKPDRYEHGLRALDVIERLKAAYFRFPHVQQAIHLFEHHNRCPENRCKHCGISEGLPHVKSNHKFERDERLPAWRGWRAAQSGVGTSLDRLGVSVKAISRILRHSNTSVTLNHYVKPKLNDVISEMEKFEAEIAIHERSDSNRTLKSDINEKREIVN